MKNGKIEVNWTKTIIAILIIPAILLLAVPAAMIQDKMIRIIVMTLLYVIGFFIVTSMYRDVLADNWRHYKQHFWRGLLISILGVVGAIVIVSAGRFVVTNLLGFSATSGGTSSGSGIPTFRSAAMGAIFSISALLAPWTEELILRHVLFFQWTNRGRAATITMWIVSSVAFGLIHWNNFDGNIPQMVPYMLVGAWFAGLYYFTKNIWTNIITHFLFDVMTPVAAIGIFIYVLIAH